MAPQAVATPTPASASGRSHLLLPVLQAALALASLLLLGLHFVHLTADFPANTPWMDWAKYTDEGWYGDAAIRLLTLGHWRVPGDFNPAVALPVWPALEVLLFRLTGVSIAAARALAVSVFVLITVVAASLVRDCLRRLAPAQSAYRTPSRVPRTFALLTLIVLSSSAFCFAFSRVAVLEPLLILLGLIALRQAIRLGRAPTTLRAVTLGLLLTLMVLTKTTALFLAPSILLALWAASGWRLRPTLRPAVTAVATSALLWLAYYGLLVRPHLLADFRYLFSANAYTGITAATARSVLTSTLQDVTWIGTPSAIAALLSILIALALPRLRRDPLVPSLLLWTVGYAAFLAYHDNLQPRYYLVLAIPLLTLPPLVLGALALRPSAALRQSAVLGLLGLLLIAGYQSRRTIGFVRRPTFRFLAAARGIASIISSNPTHRRLLLSISGADISLMTGIPSICDDFGTDDLDDRIEHFQPGWYAAWNEVEDDKMDALTQQFHLERVASFPAYDDPERNLLILYRLDTPGEHAAVRRHRHHPIPRSLQTRSGQQPSPNQLLH